MSAPPTETNTGNAGQAAPGIDDAGLKATVAEVLGRWPSAGLAAGVVRGGGLEWFTGHGVASVRSERADHKGHGLPHRVHHQDLHRHRGHAVAGAGPGRLDAPASGDLRSFPASPGQGQLPGPRPPAAPAHPHRHYGGSQTAPAGYGLRRPAGWAETGTAVGRVLQYSPAGKVEPGTMPVCSNHGFAVLGHFVRGRDRPVPRPVSARPRLPAAGDGAHRPDPVRAGPAAASATGYMLRPGGLKQVADRELARAGAGGIPPPRSRWTTTLSRPTPDVRGASTARCSSPPPWHRCSSRSSSPIPASPAWGWPLSPATRAVTDRRQDRYRASRLPAGDGPAPEDGIGVFALSNGLLIPAGARLRLAAALLAACCALPGEAIGTGIPPRPEVSSELCGWYGPDPGPVTNLFARMLWGAGVEVSVHGGQLIAKPLTPVPGHAARPAPAPRRPR